MKRFITRLSAVWALLCGRDFILTTLHISHDKYISTHKDCINVPTYELTDKFVDTAIQHLNEIKAEIQKEKP